MATLTHKGRSASITSRTLTPINAMAVIVKTTASNPAAMAVRLLRSLVRCCIGRYVTLPAYADKGNIMRTLCVVLMAGLLNIGQAAAQPQAPISPEQLAQAFINGQITKEQFDAGMSQVRSGKPADFGWDTSRMAPDKPYTPDQMAAQKSYEQSMDADISQMEKDGVRNMKPADVWRYLRKQNGR